MGRCEGTKVSNMSEATDEQREAFTHSPYQATVCASCDEILIKCQACGAVEVSTAWIPDGWLSCRFRREINGEPSLVSGPKLCPECYASLKMIVGVAVKRDENDD